MRHNLFATSLSLAVSSLLALAFATTASAQKEKILHDFVVAPFGIHPTSALIADSMGNLYGVTGSGGMHDAGVVFELVPKTSGKWSQKILYMFAGLADGESPIGRLLLDSAGNLYGTTEYGGANNCGTAFKLSPSAVGTWSKSALYSFCANSTDVGYPQSGLTMDPAGNLYGVAGGAAYRLVPSGNGSWTEQILYNFTSASGGIGAEHELVLDSAGNVYGVTTTGGDVLTCNIYGGLWRSPGCGTVFELSPSSAGLWNETVLYTFPAPANGNGEWEYWGATGGPFLDSAGDVFAPGELGIVELQPAGQGQWSSTLLPYVGGFPVGSLAMDAAGNVFGATTDGGSAGRGSVFEIQNTSSGWNVTTLYSFPQTAAYVSPNSGVSLDSGGNVFGTTYNSMNQNFGGSVFELIPSSLGVWALKPVYSFPSVDGNYALGDLISDAVGNLYGVAQDGGRNANFPTSEWAGVVFRLSPRESGSWQYDILYDFSQANPYEPPSGPAGPTSALVFDPSGNLYGTTEGGGAYGAGTVFKLSPTASGPWTETTLYSFGGFNGDGAWPISKLVFDVKGNLYGTTARTTGYGTGNGTVFELGPRSDGTWQEVQLHNFGGQNDGAVPVAGLVFDRSGNLYGATSGGGPVNTQCPSYTCGTIFKLSPAGGNTWNESIVHYFSGPDGDGPDAELIFDSAGNLYGTTADGGILGYGVVFKLTPAASGVWNESVLYTFKGGATDGFFPASRLTFDSAGNLYGTTWYGGTNISQSGWSSGSLYKLTLGSSGWTESIVHFFGSGASDGWFPQSGVLIDSSGNLFGTTSNGPGVQYGTPGGTVYEITPWEPATIIEDRTL